MRAIIMIVVACGFVVLALLLVMPVGVNLPDSWFGAVLIVLFIAAAGLLVYKAARLLHKSEPDTDLNQPPAR